MISSQGLEKLIRLENFYSKFNFKMAELNQKCALKRLSKIAYHSGIRLLHDRITKRGHLKILVQKGGSSYLL